MDPRWRVKRKLETRNKIHSFPRNANQRFDDALDSIKKGGCLSALKEAIDLINAGYGHANTLAGAIYEKGCVGIEHDYEKAKFYYQMAVDTVGSVEAWLALGRLYFLGKGMPENYEKAFYCYSVVDEDALNAVASLMLGRLYFEGKGVRKDIEKAKKYFAKSANMGSVFALTYLGQVAWKQGHILASIWYRSKAAILALLITLHDSSDTRLRRI